MSISELFFAIFSYFLIKKLNMFKSTRGAHFLYNNQINASALIGQSTVGHRAGKPTEKSPVFWIII